MSDGLSLEAVLQEAFRGGKRWDEEEWPRARGQHQRSFFLSDEEGWRWVASYCSPPGLMALQASCVALYRCTRSVVPGLGRRLYPHQVNAVSFALRTERGAKKSLSLSDDHSQRGGLLCCEPGMGKTLVVVCLVLKTLGLRASRQTSDVDDHRRRRRQSFGQGLRSSKKAAPTPEARGGTLVVAPASLVRHWRTEVARWRKPGLGTVYFDDQDHDLEEEDLEQGPSHYSADDTRRGRRRSPFDRARRGLSPWWGSEKAPDLVVCADARLSAEFAAERESKYRRDATRKYVSPLRSTSWLRVVVDEGQHRGIQGSSSTNVNLMLDAIPAERRWIVTGTPTTQRRSLAADALRQLGNLLVAVGACDAYHYDALVGRPLLLLSEEGGKKNNESSRSHSAAASSSALATLKTLFRRAVIRHTVREDLAIPRPRVVEARLAMSPAETHSYNSFVSFILANLLLTSMETDDVASMRDGFEVSLANPKNRKAAMHAIRNVLLCCAGGGEMVPDAGPGVLDELEFLLRSVHRAPLDAVRDVVDFVRRSAERGGDEGLSPPGRRPCGRCGLELSYLLITPCGHLLCPECVRPDHKGCVACGRPFHDVDVFVSDDAQRHTLEVYRDDRDDGSGSAAASSSSFLGGKLQSPPRRGDVGAGEWKVRCRHVHGWATRNDERARRCDRAHQKWTTSTMNGVEAFVWLQPGLELRWKEAMDEVDADATAEAFWRRNQRRQQRTPAGTLLEEAAAAAEETPLRTFAAGAPRPLHGVKDLDQHSKAFHIVTRLETALESRKRNLALLAEGRSVDTRPVRCVVFAEDRRTLDWIGHYIYLRFGEDAVFQFFGKAKNDELAKFATGVVKGWHCPLCGLRNEDATAKTCSQRFLRIKLQGGGGNNDDGGIPAPGQNPRFVGGTGRRQNPDDDDDGVVSVREELVEGYHVGRLWHAGQAVAFSHRQNRVLGVVEVVRRCSGRRPRDPALVTRRDLPEDAVRCLLLHRDGRHGLSLPFVTHLFLVSTIWEPSIEQQVISRAARIGATHPVTVEQLLMRRTAEDDLYGLSHQTNNSEDKDDTNGDQDRINAFLRELRLMRPSSSSEREKETTEKTGRPPVSPPLLPPPKRARRVTLSP